MWKVLVDVGLVVYKLLFIDKNEEVFIGFVK